MGQIAVVGGTRLLHQLRTFRTGSFIRFSEKRTDRQNRKDNGEENAHQGRYEAEVLVKSDPAERKAGDQDGSRG